MPNEQEMQNPSIEEFWGAPEELFWTTFKLIEPHLPMKKYSSLYLRKLEEIHYPLWATLRALSPEELQAYEPEWDVDELSPQRFMEKLNPSPVYPSFHYSIEVSDEDTTFMAGCISVNLPRGGSERAVRLAYWVGKPFRKIGIASEALKEIVRGIFEEGYYRRVEAYVCPENLGSRKALTNAGFKQEGLVQKPLQINGEYRDHYLYGIVKENLDSEETLEQYEDEGPRPSLQDS